MAVIQVAAPPRTCEFCWFFTVPDDAPDEVKESRGECRRRAPTTCLQGGACAHWPVTSKTDWCGDFALNMKRWQDKVGTN